MKVFRMIWKLRFVGFISAHELGFWISVLLLGYSLPCKADVAVAPHVTASPFPPHGKTTLPCATENQWAMWLFGVEELEAKAYFSMLSRVPLLLWWQHPRREAVLPPGPLSIHDGQSLLLMCLGCAKLGRNHFCCIKPLREMKVLFTAAAKPAKLRLTWFMLEGRRF